MTNDSMLQYAVKVEKAYKSYGQTEVLKGLDMTVPTGTIYALLGPSGCGKTTLLSCLVGRLKLDSGVITTVATKRDQIGYMPQTTALYLQLSIAETFAYYGRVYGMSWVDIEERAYILDKLLELPSPNRIVETLSGGQQRRVSLAVSLIHNPSVLILDEPTVGLDPVLSDSIWQHMLKLTRREKKTIVITTHYIEEARQAQTVGLMRGGVLLCEETPADLMSKNDCDSMESAFLKLSYIQETTKSKEVPEFHRGPKKKKSHLQKGPIFSKSSFVAEIVKNWFFIWRNKPCPLLSNHIEVPMLDLIGLLSGWRFLMLLIFRIPRKGWLLYAAFIGRHSLHEQSNNNGIRMLLFLFGLPLTITLLFNIAIGHNPNGLKIALVNEEDSNGVYNCLLKQALPGCNLTYVMGCRFVKQLYSSSMVILEYDDLESAFYATKKNEVWGVIHIPTNYTQSVVDKIANHLQSKRYTVEHGTISVWLDMSNQNIGTLLNIEIFSEYIKYMEDLYEDCGWHKQLLYIPIRMMEPIYGETEANLNHYASPAIIILLIFYLPMSYTIGVLVQEKLLGVLERSLVAGVTLVEVFISHTVIQIIILGFQISIAMIVLYYIYESPFIGDPIGTVLLLLLQGISGIAFGFLVSMAFDKMLHATFASLGSVFSYFFLSGMVWPQQGAHIIVRWFRWAVPVSYSVEAMRALTVKGWDVTHPLVLKGFFSVTAWIVLFCLSAHIVLRVRKGVFVS